MLKDVFEWFIFCLFASFLYLIINWHKQSHHLLFFMLVEQIKQSLISKLLSIFTSITDILKLLLSILSIEVATTLYYLTPSLISSFNS